MFAEDRRLDKGPGSSNTFVFEESREVDVKPFMLDGWLKLGLRLSHVKSDEYAQDEYYPNVPQVKIRVLKDHHIRKDVASTASTDVFGIPTSYVFLCPPNRSLKSVKKMVCSHRLITDADGHVDLQIQKDAQLDSSQSTLWIRSSKRNGSLLKAVCMDALEELDFRLWELSAKMEQSPGHTITFYLRSINKDVAAKRPQGSIPLWHTIAFYFRSTEKDVTAKRPQDPFLLFCIFMDTRKRKLKYLGSVEVAKNATLHSVFLGPVRALDERINGSCSFFAVHPENSITRISPSHQTTIKQVRPCPY